MTDILRVTRCTAPDALLPLRDFERVNECLAVLAQAIEKMREAVGKPGPKPKREAVRMEFAKDHDRMLTSLIVAVGPFVRPMILDIPANSYSRGCAVLECGWKQNVDRPLDEVDDRKKA